MQTVHLTQIIHETQSNVDYCGLLLKQAQTLPAAVPDRKQTTGCKQFVAAVCNMCRWKLGQLAQCTAVCQMHGTQLLTAVFTECTADRQCFVWERRTVIVTG